MNGEEFRIAIARLGLSQVAAAHFLGINASTVRKWCMEQHKVPVAVELLLRMMVRDSITPDDVLMVARNRLRA